MTLPTDAQVEAGVRAAHDFGLPFDPVGIKIILTAALAADDGWRPIAEAPRDGTRVLVSVAGAPPVVATWRSKWNEWQTSPGLWRVKPDRFRPLPAPPQDRSEP